MDISTGTEVSTSTSLAVRAKVEETPAEFAHLFASIERQVGWGSALTSDAISGSAAPYVLGVTSAVVGEGKTTVAMHLALKMAWDTHKKVCLIDLSLGDDDLRRRMGLPSGGAGVIQLLESVGASVSEPPQICCEGLTVMIAGKRPDNAARAARSPYVGELIGAAREKFDIIILDLPALATENLLPLAHHADGLIMVTRAGATPKGEVARAVQEIGHERVLGLVMNRVRFAVPQWLQRRFRR